MGTVIGWSSPANKLIQQQLGTNTESLSWISSIMALGAASAQIFMALVIDRFGRKNTMLVLAPPFVVGWIILAFANSVPVYCLGRFVTGFCGGAFCVAAPTYIGELADKEIRGTLGVLFQLLLTMGIMVSYCLSLTESIKVSRKHTKIHFRTISLPSAWVCKVSSTHPETCTFTL